MTAGRWEGMIQIPDRELPLVVDLERDDTDWRGSVTLPGFGIKGAPLKDVVVKGDEVAFTLETGPEPRGLQARFKGRLSTEQTLSGEFVQGGNTAGFTLRKTGVAQVELPKRNTPVKRELEGEWKGDYELNGYPRHVSVQLKNGGADGGATSEMIVVGKRTTKIPMERVTQEGDFLVLESPSMGMSYEGAVKKDSTEIRGTFLQGPLEIPLVLHRTDTAP